jgi:lipopolysaccharide transport system ATP-binding protein
MTDIAIRASNVSKQYRIGAKQEGHKTLVETIGNAWKAPFRWFRGHRQSKTPLFWALKDVGFEIKKGEVVGIIGRNGSGKSTLLKILSRITEPTCGFVEGYGRVGSLLEVGTGFHPELSGRENIFLNGAILGMRKSEIEKRFDEIVAFAETEKFIDTQVKHYSSGMYLRLAFAVAAHLEPEILLVDEVLAVGDATFQKKCLNKMEEVGNEGRTVVFVSHNMPAITRLCHRCILLDEGRIVCDGPSPQTVNKYLNQGVLTSAEREWPEGSNAPGSDVVRLRAVRIKTQDGLISNTIDIRQSVRIEMDYEILREGYLLIPHFSLHNHDGIVLFSAVENDISWRGKFRPVGFYRSTATIPGNLLTEGMVIVGPAVNTLNPNILHFHARDAVAFSVVDSFEGDSARGEFPDVLNGVVRPLLKWETILKSNGHLCH